MAVYRLFKMSMKIPELRKCNRAMEDLSSIERQEKLPVHRLWRLDMHM